MAKNIETSNELFALIKNNLFKNVAVETVIHMTEEEQRDFMLQQLERLLDNDCRLASWFASLFWTSGEDGRMMKQGYNPFFSPDDREAMTEQERELCAFYLTLSGMCHDLYHHNPFDPMLLGIDGAESEFFVDNTPLVSWLLTTPYQRTASHIAFTMRDQGLQLMIDSKYNAGRDYLNNLQVADEKVKSPEKMKSLDDYVFVIIDALKDIDEHLTTGTEMGLTPEQIFAHDEYAGGFMVDFDDYALRKARR